MKALAREPLVVVHRHRMIPMPAVKTNYNPSQAFTAAYGTRSGSWSAKIR